MAKAKRPPLSKTERKRAVADTLAWLKAASNARIRGDMLARYGITASKAFGLKVGDLRARAKLLGQDHGLAQDLWATGWYEARMIAVFVDDPQYVTEKQMEAWARDFDNWAICDTACFHLFDKTPHAFGKIKSWSGRKEEFVKRAGFALLASVALHGKMLPDSALLDCLPLIEKHAGDGRNFVKKAVSWALRSIGHCSLAARKASLSVANKLAASQEPSCR